jgi:uncharacterized protein YecE (DUF72 family)
VHFIGTAGWSIPRNSPPGEGTHLHRYSRTLSCVEINSTFYRIHRQATFEKWAVETPTNFRFSLKAPKAITHEAKLLGIEQMLKDFLTQVETLREKAGPILFQFPPSLEFDPIRVADFLNLLRTLYHKGVAFEPRHASWFSHSADELLRQHHVSRVAADPPKGSPLAANPGGDTSLVYYRLHGSPRTYYSNYEEAYLKAIADKVTPHNNAWIIFDNTAGSHAYGNAVTLQRFLSRATLPHDFADSQI